MSARIEPPRRPVDDDDWFATVQEGPAEIDQRPSLDLPRYVPPAPAPPDLGRRQVALVVAVLVAIFLVLAGIVLGRATKDSSSEVVTVTATVTEPAASPEATAGTDESTTATTPDTTTPDTTTPDSAAETPATSTPSANAVPTGPTLRPGATGASVVALQKALTSLGYEAGASDGTYGAKTAQAVAAFQTANNLTADGLAGAKTVAAINAALATG